MTDITTAISNDLQTNSLSGLANLSSDTNEMIETINPISDSIVSDEPPTKKSKITSNDKLRLLEDRISSILSCCICLDLSTLSIFQCVNGHLMCASCFNHLLADCKLKDEQTTCLSSHLTVCEYPNKTGLELIDTIQAQKCLYDDEKKSLETVVDLLSLNQIGVSDLVLKPFRTDDFVVKLYFETSRFTALQYQWQVRARINDNIPHPHTTITRSLSYQLVLKSKINQTIDLKFFILKGPHGDPSTSQIQPIIYHFEFNQNNTETEYLKLPISSQECNRMLSSSSISFRLLMVQLDKP
ncbi:unnamed protein product [Rotaria socialis]|uniref:Uncharacterized protein n=1 Tax=Rotaria socialis TaxID=392032 RepID=A0A820PVJ6_9BILA|nr:unnamed protein product [Rotaria socialis]